jgi:nucleotide-binding universal stress UspA family protein
VSRIVAGVDFGETTGHTVHSAAQLAARWRASLELVHAVEEAHGMERWGAMVDTHQQQQLARAERELHLLADEIRGTAPTVVVRTALGAPELVLSASGSQRDDTLLVLGLRSRQGLLGAQPGSIAYRVLCLSEVPVLVVPPPGRPARQHG